MKNPPKKGSPLAWKVLVAALALHILSVAAIVPFVPDDAYISFRYAENVSDGAGLTFNGRERPVEGYSNFLWILVCGVIYSAGVPLPTGAPLVGVLFGLLTIFVLWRIYQRRGVPEPHMWLPLLLAAASGPFVLYAASGLETAMFAFLLLSLVHACDRLLERGTLARHLSVAGIGFATALCRPEGVLAYPIVILALMVRRRSETAATPATQRNLWAGAGVFAATYAAYTAWRVTYFGEFLPTPFLSKVGGGDALVAGWLTNLKQYFVMQGYEFTPLGYYFAAVAVLAFVGYNKGPGASLRPGTDRVSLVLGLIYAAVYFNFVDWMPGMRYHAALIPLFFVSGVNIQSIRMQGGVDVKPTRLTKRFVLVGVGVMLISTSFLMQLRITAKRIERGNRLGLIALADWLTRYGPPNPTLAISDVGVIPYYTRFYTIDINPESLTDLHIAKEGFSEAYFYSKRPDVVVLVARGVFAPKMYPEHFALASSEKFVSLYRFIGAVRYLWFEDRSYWVFVPKDWPRLSDEAFEAFPGGIGGMRRLER